MDIPAKDNSFNEAFTRLSFMSLARANVFRSLALAFYDPSQEFIEKLVNGVYVSELSGYYSDLIKHSDGRAEALDPLKEYQANLAMGDESELLKELKVEYARLFIGPAKPAVSPYETTYGKRAPEGQHLLIVSPEAIAVEKEYQEAGLVMQKKSQEPPDHFAIELEFLYYVSKKESDSWTEGKNDEANQCHRRELAFIKEHIGKWGLVFCENVEKESHQPFYRAISHFTLNFIQMESNHTEGSSGL